MRRIVVFLSFFLSFIPIFSAARKASLQLIYCGTKLWSLGCQCCEIFHQKKNSTALTVAWRIFCWIDRFNCCFFALHIFAAIKTTKTREHFAESSYTTQLGVQTMHSTRIVLPVASTIARAEICLGCWRDRPFLNRTHLVFDEVIPMGRQ